MRSFLRTGLFTCLAAGLFAALEASAAGENWATDLETAQATAAEQNKPILADFIGSDWCSWCKKLEEEVFSQEVFKEFAGKNLVPCIIDFPRDKSKISEEQAAKNKKYAAEYGVRGYPTVLLLEPDGSVFLRTGYREGGADAYVKFLDSVIHARSKVVELEASPGPEPEKADELLEQIPAEALILRARLILASYPEDDIAKRAEAAFNLINAGQDEDGKHRRYLEDAGDKDPEGYFLRIVMGEATQEALQAYRESASGGSEEAKAKTQAAAQKLLAATKKAEPYLDEEKEKQEKQMLLLLRSLAYRLLDDQAGVDEAWKQAEAIDPKSPMLNNVRPMVRPTAEEPGSGAGSEPSTGSDSDSGSDSDTESPK